jgi:hypothetical protein
LLTVPISLIVAGIITIQLVALFTILTKADYYRLFYRYGQDTAVLTILFLLHLFITSSLSPLHWKMAILTFHSLSSAQVFPVASIFDEYVLAKQFSFSNVDHAQWAALMNPPGTLNSPFMQLLVFILNLPSISFEVYHKVIMLINFILVVLGSFGFYLFLRYAAKLTLLFSLFGGCLFFFSGTPFIEQMYLVDAGIFISSYAAFPYALLFLTLAFKHQDLRWACWAGIALATPFFFMAPHPEGIIYSCSFYGVYAIGLCIFANNLNLSSRLKLASVSIFSFLVLSLFTLLPIGLDCLRGNMYVIGHVGDIVAAPLEDCKIYIKLLCCSILISLTLLKINKRMSTTYLSALFLSIVMLLGIYLITKVDLQKALTQILHTNIHFSVIWRIGMYFFLSVTIIALFALQEITTLCYNLLTTRVYLKRVQSVNE